MRAEVCHRPSGSISVPAVVYIQHEDLTTGFVDAVSHPILAAACAPKTFIRRTQRRSHDPGSLEQWSGDELTRCERRRRGECVGQSAPCPRCEDDAVPMVVV
jgi:hypothetical protein